MKRYIVAFLLLSCCLCMTAVAQEQGQGDRQRGERPNLKPTLFANLGEENYTPDGMALHTQTGALYLNVPNFGITDENQVKVNSAQGGYLYEVGKDGKVTSLTVKSLSSGFRNRDGSGGNGKRKDRGNGKRGNGDSGNADSED